MRARTAALARQRNGGRHRCQPPLRRAKDPSNFANGSQGNPCSELQLTSSGVASHQSAPSERSRNGLYSSAPAEASLLFRATRPDPKVKADRCSAALLGMTLTASRFASGQPEDRLLPRRAFERSSLPAPLPGWPRKAPEGTFHCLPRRSDLWTPAAPSCRCRPPGEARDRRPDHPWTLTRISESRQAKYLGPSLWITGISGKRREPFFIARTASAPCCRSVLSGLPRPSA